MQQSAVADVRRFNRTVTEHIGALDDRFLGLGRPLGEARLLWEIGPDGCELRELRARLGLDSGYLSRLVRTLETAGLVTSSPNETDRRSRVARLTAAGAAERRILDQRSDESARSVLESLEPAQQEELVAAMARVERLLTAGAVEIRPVDPEHRDARRCFEAYVAELNDRSEIVYDPTAGPTAEPPHLRPPAGVLLVAYLRGAAVGCGAVKHRPGAPSHLKRMWVSPSVRGLGVGRRLLAELEAAARAAGAPAVQLETNRILTEAIALYRTAGYAEVAAFNDEPFGDHWFEKQL